MTQAAAATKKQAQLSGMEDKADPEVTKLALKYREARDARMKLTVKEVEARTLLEQKMVEKNLDVYRDHENDLLVELVEKTKVKVRALVIDEDGEAEE